MRNKALVVVVEDNSAIAELFKEIIEGTFGCLTILVADGNDAVDVVRSEEPDLVLMDVDLPGMNGTQIYDRMQKEDCTRSIPVLFVTASQDISELKYRGIRDYLPKPFELDDLLSRIEASAPSLRSDYGPYSSREAAV